MQQINPQPISKLKERYNQAVKPLYDVQKVMVALESRPGNKEEHIFDFLDGIRLIISREKWKEKEVLHFSASVSEEYKVNRNLTKRFALAEFLGQCTQHITELSGCKTKDVHLVMITDGKGVPHWIVELVNLN